MGPSGQLSSIKYRKTYLYLRRSIFLLLFFFFYFSFFLMALFDKVIRCMFYQISDAPRVIPLANPSKQRCKDEQKWRAEFEREEDHETRLYSEQD
jgi:hypothetical protein